MPSSVLAATLQCRTASLSGITSVTACADGGAEDSSPPCKVAESRPGREAERRCYHRQEQDPRQQSVSDAQQRLLRTAAVSSHSVSHLASHRTRVCGPRVTAASCAGPRTATATVCRQVQSKTHEPSCSAAYLLSKSSRMEVGARSCRSAPHMNSPTRMYGTMSASCSRRATQRMSSHKCGEMHRGVVATSEHGGRTSKGTDTKFASSVMGPCSSGLDRKMTATEMPADTPAPGGLSSDGLARWMLYPMLTAGKGGRATCVRTEEWAEADRESNP